MAILNTKEQRLISLLNFLENNNDTTISNLANLLECSKSTVLNDLSFFTNNWSELIDISINKEQTVILKTTSNGNINQIVREIISGSLEVQLLKEIFLHPYQNIFYYAEKLYVSPSTLYRSMKKLKPFLKEWGLAITNKNKTYGLTSNNEVEFEIVFFVVKYLEEIYALQISKLKLSSQFDYFSAHYSYALEEEQHFLYLVWYLIHSKDLEKGPTFDHFVEIYNEITIGENFHQVINHFVQTVSKWAIITPKDHETLNSIFSYCKKRESLFTLPQYMIYNRYTSFVDTFASQNPHIFDKLKKAIHHSLERLGMNVEYHFDYLFYLILTNCHLIIDEKYNKNLIVCSDLGGNHGEFLAYSITRAFLDAPLSIKVVDKSFFNNYDYQPTDLIISTTKLPCDAPVLFVNDYLTEKQYYKLRKELKIAQ
ncbi:helix-turn-helix domain-containing protein [Vagococcus hydrophili]|uniref:Mga helix-turn-helix domain-containing protein n=1 Tax=Vagococcus hydrophili TaxID=2714947 RepID=A0A6G8ASH2_9ENTE|nr:helix-turn-helix domain-containing protein [Vagococcus hydrophili]QIL47919.1 hypothetical protein G7082_04915 [Vagococcus hydrophili]